MTNTTPLAQSFFSRDTHAVARDLLGKLLIRKVDQHVISGRITEVECYVGVDDAACHAAHGKTERNQIMFGPAGHAYIYLIYGMYNCLNIVTEAVDFPAAILIRSLEPTNDLAFMMQRRGQSKINNLTTGPGKLCQAMAIDRSLNENDLTKATNLWIANGSQRIRQSEIMRTARIGVDYAGSSAKLPWRYLINNNQFVSAALPSYSK